MQVVSPTTIALEVFLGGLSAGVAPITVPRRHASPPADGSDSSQQVGGAAHAARAPVEHMRVDHRGAYVVVTEQLLDCADVCASLQ